MNSSHLSHLLLSLQSTDLSLEILNMFIPNAKQYKTQTNSTRAEKFTRCRDSARLLMEAYDSASQFEARPPDFVVNSALIGC